MCLVASAVQNIQSTMLRQISSVVEDELSEMSEPDVVALSPQQPQIKYHYISPYYLSANGNSNQASIYKES